MILSILCLVIICLGYYFFHQKYPREEKELIYFGIFVVCYCIILYLINYERDLVYKILKHVYETHKQPLYSLNALESNTDFLQSTPDISSNYNQKLTIEENILQQQGSRCSECKNFILMKDKHTYHLDYKRSLYHGGSPTMDNLCVICQNCYNFKRN